MFVMSVFKKLKIKGVTKMPDKLIDSEIVKALECCTKLRYDIQQPPTRQE